MGKGPGLDAASATSWDRLFKVLQLAQRRYVILENRCGIAKHPDFHEILRAMLYCGYVLIAKRVCDATSMECVARPRVAPPRPHFPCVSSLGPPMSCKQSGSVWQNMPENVASKLRLDDDELSTLRRRELLPPWLRRSPKNVMSLRLVNPVRPFPSITAAYHRCEGLACASAPLWPRG